MAYLGRFGWLALCAALITHGGPWRQMREMASLDGANRVQTAARVIVPLAWPILGAAAVLVMILALTEVRQPC